jgi:hypothetical protein
MKYAVLSLALGALTFWGQDIPGLRVGFGRSWSGVPSVNFRTSDLNQDGAPDLVLAREVLFQEDGGFPAKARIALPEVPENAQLDVWNGDLFFRWPGKLAVFRWDGKAWQAQLDQPLEWPVDGIRASQLGFGGQPDRPPASLERFVQDLDHDGVPELIAASEEAVHVYGRSEGIYQQVAAWTVLPPLTLAAPAHQEIWPPDRRALAFPARQMSCRLVFERDWLQVLTREETIEAPVQGDGPGVIYQTTSYRIEPGAGWVLQHDAARDLRSPSLPLFVHPCRLNADSAVDYAGGRWSASSASALPRPIYETWATLDGGKTFEVRRAVVWPGFQPRCSFVDFDGDGDLDMVVECTLGLDQGIRETVMRFMTRNGFDHEIQVFRQAEGRFSKTPELRKAVRLHLEQPPVRGGPEVQRYTAGELTDISGDFNGDGYRDLLVQTAPGKLSIFLATGFAYPERPDAGITLEQPGYCAVADVNGDQRSDVVVRWTVTAGDRPAERTRVYFAREALP